MSSVIKEVRETAEYRKYQKILARAQGAINLDDSRGEALMAHGARLSRKLHGDRRYSPKALDDALAHDMSTRARLVEIRVRVSIASEPVEAAVKAIRRYISTEFADDLREFSTSELRRAFVDRILKTGITYLAEVQALLDVLDLLIKDLDSAGFALKNMVETLKILDSSKGSKVV